MDLILKKFFGAPVGSLLQIVESSPPLKFATRSVYHCILVSAIHIIFHFAAVSFKGSPSLNPLADPILVINLEFAGELASCSCRLQVDHEAFLCTSL